MKNSEYWKNEGAQKVFTHPVISEWLTDIDKQESILDLGCGYGRLTPVLREEGFCAITAYDPSTPLIERASRENPGAVYTSDVNELLDGSFGLVLCFALFTSCPPKATAHRRC